ncbi:MAG TPA: hypothetical protein VM841_05290 [Actinomycetota bacterium]|nr:hypothetical protein [Actinomycetota bacterium]
MKARLLTAALALGIVGFGPAATALPANDNFADAQPVALNSSTSTSTLGATRELGEPGHCNSASTVWYRFEPQDSSSVRIDTAGSNYDTTLAVYTGTASPPAWDLELVDCNDDTSEDLTSAVGFQAEAGQTYYIQAGGFDGAQGSLVLTVQTAGAISGSVRLEDGNPVDVCVRVHMPDGRDVGGTWAYGDFLIQGLPAGEFAVAFYPCGGQNFREEWWEDKPSLGTADLVTVVAGQTTTGIDAVVAEFVPEPSPIDVALTSIRVENVPLRTDAATLPGTGTVRDIVVTIENVGEAAAEGWVDIVACPKTGPFCQFAGYGFVSRLDPGQSRTVTVRWNAAGGFGDFTIDAYGAFMDTTWQHYDRNWGNDWLTIEHYVILGGTGFGVGV